MSRHPAATVVRREEDATASGSQLRAIAPFVIYPLLALLSFPTIELLIAHRGAWTYTLDVFDDGGGLARLAMAVRDWSAHGPTLWDPYLTGGNALLGQFALPPYAPDAALAFVVGPFWAYAIWGWAIASIAGIGMHLFLRDSVRLSMPAVVAGSIIAVFCFWHPIYGISIAVFPLLLWLGDRAARGGHRAWFTAGGIGASALALYAGQLQVVVLVAVIELAWTLVTGAGERKLRLGLWFGTWAVAFGLYGPVLTTQLVMVPISERSVWNIDYLYGTGVGHAFSVVLHHYGSVLLGIPVSTGMVPSEARYGTLFLDGVGGVLLVTGVVAGRRGRVGLFLAALLLVIPLVDFGAILAAHVQEGLGVLRSFQFVRIRHFFPFALASVAALGTQALLSGALTAGRWRRWAVAVAALAFFVPVAAQTGIAISLAAVHLGRFIGTPRDVGWPLAAVGLAAGLAGGIVLIVGILRRSATPGRALILSVAILFVAGRAFLASGGPLLGPNIGSFQASLGLTSGQAFLLRQPEIAHERVLTFGDHANRMAFEGIRQADGYQAIYPLAYHGFFGALTDPGLHSDPGRFAYFHFYGARAYAFAPGVDPELVALAGARWLYVRGSQVPTVPGLIKRFSAGNITVYEDPDAFPRAFVVGAVRANDDAAGVLTDLAAASLGDLRGTAYATGVDAAALARSLGDGAASTSQAGTPGPAGTATITVDVPDRLEIDIKARRPAILILTDTAAPGWVAEVDGKEVAVRIVDGAFRGIPVDAATRHVMFVYQPGFTLIGFAIAGISLAAAVLWVSWIGRRRARRWTGDGAAPGPDGGRVPEPPTEGEEPRSANE